MSFVKFRICILRLYKPILIRDVKCFCAVFGRVGYIGVRNPPYRKVGPAVIILRPRQSPVASAYLCTFP